MSPKTYLCRPCAITYSFDGMREEWKAFIRSLGISVRFLHRDELAAGFSIDTVLLSAAFLCEGSKTKF
ncbi:hypothetical protein ACFLTM_05555 [Candidatus Bipolaricaulota bacterium]